MLHDVYVIQLIYGANGTTRAGDTVYGFNSTADRDVFDFSDTDHPIVTIWDGGGNDTLDLSGYSSNAVIDLNDGEYSSAGALTLNIAIAFDAMIENAVGGAGNDQIRGQELANMLDGGDGNDRVDYFSFRVDRDESLVFELSGLSSDIDFYLFDDEGQFVIGSERTGNTDEIFSLNVSAGQDYILEVIPFEGASEYRLQIEATNPDPDDASNDYRNPTPLPLPADTSQSVGIGPDQSDYYVIEAETDGQLAFSLTDLDADIDIYVYELDGVYLGSSTEEGNRDESFNVNVNAGRSYLVEVIPFVDAGSDYRLQIDASAELVDADNEPFGETRIELVDSISQSVGFGDDIADYFRLTASETGTLIIELSDLQADIDLFLLDSAGSVLASSVLESNRDERIFQNVRAGEVYYISVQPFDGASDYRLSTRLTTEGAGDQDDNNSAATATVITIPATASGTIGIQGDDADYFRFVAPTSGTINVSLSGMSADADLLLLDSNQELLARSTNFGTTPEALAVFTEPGAQYYVVVEPWDPDGTVYELELSISDSTSGQDAGDDFPIATILVPGSNVIQDVGGDDLLDVFQLIAPRYGLLSLNLNNLSADLDLLLFDGNGSPIASSRLAGSSPESIAYLVEAGQTYYFLVAPWEDARSTYSLNVDLNTDVLIYEDLVQSAYIAYYGRAADPGGLSFWLDQLSNSDGNLGAITDEFSSSQEFLDRYSDQDNIELVDSIFEQLFGRDPDPEGQRFYVESLDSGSRSLASITLDILLGAQNEDRVIVDNKVQVADYFTELLSRSGFDYRGSEAADEVKSVFDQVTTDLDSSFLLVDEFFAQFPAAATPASAMEFDPMLSAFDHPDYHAQVSDELFSS